MTSWIDILLFIVLHVIKSMSKADLTREITIREVILRKELDCEKDGFWAEEERSPTSNSRQLGNLAYKAGYQVGDTFKYIIIIEPKK